jgi:hypothetical protein
VLALDMKSLFLPLSLLVFGGFLLCRTVQNRSLRQLNISVSPTESAEAREAYNFPMRELLPRARRMHPIRKRTLNK